MPHTREYPIDFVFPTDKRLRDTFDQIGLIGNNQTGQRVRDALAAKGNLLTMRRPVNTARIAPYYHVAYAKAALSEVPNLHKTGWLHSDWLSMADAHLQAFAAQDPQARELVVQSIVSYYHLIAGQAIRLGNGGDEAWISAYQTPQGTRPLDFLVVSHICHLRLPISDRLLTLGRTYLPLGKIAGHIGWTIPGIENPGMQSAILDEFERNRNAEHVVDPQTLFMAGKIILQGAVEQQVAELFPAS